ncbi:MAG: C25 family cysteine peptidase [Phycisphaerae bacterium]
MRKQQEFGRGARIVTAVAFGFLLMASRSALADGGRLTLSATIPVGSPDVMRTAQGHEVSIEDFGYLLVPGKPALPSRVFAVAIPPGAEVVDVSFDMAEGVPLPGVHAISPAPLPRVIGEEDPFIYEQDKARYEANRKSVYGSDDAYPKTVAEFVRTAGYREYNLVDVRVTPVTYRPLSGRLTYYPEVTVHVNYTLPGKPAQVIVDDRARTERIAREIIVNYDQARSMYPRGSLKGRALHDFVIITLDSLVSSVTPLVNWEDYKGRTVEVVTTSWIDTYYNGYDLAEKMRNFLREKYPVAEWGIEDVLLVGDYDDVPMRRTAQDLGYGRPETDFYYAELSLPDNESWDADEDRQWGEGSDPIDFYAEVNVGRIPWSDAGTVVNICEKSAAYEQNNDPAFKKNILLLGGYFWADTDNAVLMEAKADQPWMSDWTMTRMYEQNTDYWSTYGCDYPLLHSNVMAVWSSGTYAFVNWAGHGSPTSTHILGLNAPAFIAASDCPSLDDNYPAIIFADACSNSDTDYLSIGQSMIKQGAVGFVGATKVALGQPGWNDPLSGSSQSMDYFFTTRVTSGDYSQGEAHQLALRDMYIYGLWDALKYETFEWGALWGNPGLRMSSPSPLSITFPNGRPEYLEPGTPTTFTVQIVNGVEDYVPGSGTLHYRYDGGTFLTSPLVHDTGNYYEATLPAAGVGMTPEYYISAQGDGGSTVFNPFNAPSTVYTAIVGTFAALWTDNLDTDPGWTTEGLWAFGQPTGGGGEYGGPDPTGGHTGSNVYGYNLSGDYENYLDETHLTSGPFDCTDVANVTLKFWRWLGVEQPLYDHAYIRASTNGTDWTTVWENLGEITDTVWTLREVDISSVADGESTVYLRWTMGSTDVGWRYCGWNIDDIEVWGLITAVDPCADGVLGDGEERIDCGGPCPPCECTSDEVCIDDLFCNGTESCDALGHCQDGVAPCPPPLCHEDTDTCGLCALDEDCADGLYCNGVEWCDPMGSCQPGASVDCADGLGCTIDACNEDTDSCDHEPDDAVCYDGNVCTVDWCDVEAGCINDGTGVTDPCDDEDPCTTDDVCQGDAAGTCAGMVALPPRPEEPTIVPKNRFISFVPDNPGQQTALRVTLTSLPEPFTGFNGTVMWVDGSVEVSETPSNPGNTPPPTFMGAELGCSPRCMDWSALGPIHVFDGEIVPGAVYDVQAINCICAFSDESNYSSPLTVSTSIWGDLVGNCDVMPCTPPDGQVDFIDISAAVDKFRNLPGAPIKARTDIASDVPDKVVDFIDILYIVEAFRGLPYPFDGPSGCP